MWDKIYGDIEWDRAKSLVATSDGGYALAGYTSFSIGVDGGDFWLVKTDSSGNMVWNKTYGGTGFDAALSLVVTSDGGYAIAGFTSSFGAGNNDFWLVKTDSSGNMIWNKTYGGTADDRVYSLVVTSDGGYALAGYTSSFGVGGGDFWLVKTDASGNMMWNQTYGGTGDDYGYSLVVTSDGGYAMAGVARSFGAGGGVFWLVKTDASGNMMWNQTYGERNYDSCAYSLVVSSDGGYALTGSISDSGSEVDFWLVKTDGSGNMVWNQTYGETLDDTAFSIIQTADGGYAIAGYAAFYVSGAGTNVWLVKTDAFGNMMWNQTYGGTGDDAASSVVQTADGGYALAADTTSFGAGDYDFWLIKTDEFGVISEFQLFAVPLLLIVTTMLAVVVSRTLFFPHGLCRNRNSSSY